MQDFGMTLDHLLTYPVLGNWWYTLGRAVLLLFLLVCVRQARRLPWIWAGLGISGTLIAARVVGDLAIGGANTPYTVYNVLGNIGTAVLYIGVARMANLLHALRLAKRELAVARAQRDSARLWVHQYQGRLEEPLTAWPDDKGAA